jgi:hypothetical protein
MDVAFVTSAARIPRRKATVLCAERVAKRPSSDAPASSWWNDQMPCFVDVEHLAPQDVEPKPHHDVKLVAARLRDRVSRQVLRPCRSGMTCVVGTPQGPGHETRRAAGATPSIASPSRRPRQRLASHTTVVGVDSACPGHNPGW